MEERRLHPRLDLPLQALAVTGNAEHRATLENLSAGGAAIRVSDEFPRGTELERFEFTLPAGEEIPEHPISSRAEVVHSERLEQPDGEGGFRSGIRFVDLPEDAFRRIQQHIFQSLTKGRPEADEMPLERRRVDVERTVSIHYDRFDKFVSEVSENISLGGMFIRTNSPKPPGSIFSFSFQLGDDFSLVEGRAEVIWTREKELGPGRHAGMGVRFLDLDERSRNTILSLVKKASEEKSPEEPPQKRIHVAAVHPKTPKAPKEIELQTSKPTAGGPEDKLRRELARRTRAYESRIAELEERIGELSARHVDEETKLRQSKSSAGELQTLNAALEQRLEEMKTKLGREKESLQSELEAANSELDELRLETKKQQDEADSARRKTAGFENRLLVIEQALRAAERERDEAKTKAKESAQALKALEKSLQGESPEEDPRIAELEGEIEESANRLQVLGERLAVAEKDREEALGALTLVSTTETSLQQAEEKQQELQAALDEAQEGLQRAHEGHDARTAELRAEIQRTVESVDAERRRAESAETYCEELEEELGTLRKDLEQERREREEIEKRFKDEAERVDAEAATRLSELERDLEKASEHRQTLEQALADAEAESLKVEREREELESGLREEARRAVDRVTDLEAAITELETRLQKAEEGRAEVEQELARAVEDKSETEQRLGQAQTRREELENEWSSREAQLLASVDENAAAMDELRGTVESLEAARDQRAIEQREQQEAARRMEEELRGELEAARGREESLRGELESGRAVADELRQRVESLEQELGGRQAEARELEEVARAAREELQSELEAARGREESLERELEEGRATGGELERRVGSLEEMLEERAAEFRQQTDAARTVEEELRAEIAEADRRETSVQQQLEAAQATERRLEDALEEVRQARDNALEEVSRLKSVAETLDRDLERVRADVAERDQQLRGLETELEQSRERGNLVAAELDERVAELAEGKQRLSAVESDLEDVRADRESLSGEMSTLQAAVRGLKLELEEAGVDPAAIAAASDGDSKSTRGRWLRAAALVVGGIGVGALVGPPGAKLLGVGGSGNWFGGERLAARSGGEAAIERPALADASLKPSPVGEALPASSETDMAGLAQVRVGEASIEEQIEEPYPEAESVAEAWASAWAEQRVDDYLWFYAEEFVPPNGMTRPEWEAYRRERVSAPASIEIVLADIAEETIDADHARVVFEQSYSAGAYSDRVRKTLEMVREDGTWKITSEQSEPL